MSSEPIAVKDAAGDYFAAVKSRKVPSGYKWSDVGVIPEDWNVAKLRDCLTRSPEYGINAPAVQYSDNLPTYIRITDISEDGRFLPESLVSVKNENSSKYFLEEGDLVFARTGASVGKSYYYKKNDGQLVFAGFLIRVKPDQNRLIPAYLANYVTTSRYWAWVRLMSMRSGQPGINGNEYGQLPVPLPPLPEQRAIAAALSDVDELIAALDKLIAKKRAIKTAAMQQLLTGKQRLPGFGNQRAYKHTEVGLIPEEWSVRLIKAVVESLEAGVSVNSVDDDSQAYVHTESVLKTSAVSNGEFKPYECKKVAPKDIRRAKLTPRANTIVISRMNTPDLVGEVGYINKDYPYLFLPDRLWMARFHRDSKVSVRWLSYLLSSSEYKAKLREVATGTSGSMKNISKESLLGLAIPFPNEREQEAIATVLSDMDAEIAALEARRDKTQAIKQGMMQELLTGRTRLA